MSTYVEIANSPAYKSLVRFGKSIETSKVSLEVDEQQKLFIVSSNADNLYGLVRKDKTFDKRTRLLISKIANTANSLMDSVGSSEFDEEHASSLKRKIRRLEKTVKSHSESELKETAEIYGIPSKPEGAYAHLSQEDLKELAASLSQDSRKEIKEVVDQNQQVLKNLQTHSSRLPKTKSDVKSSFLPVRAPVVVISTMNEKDYAAMGFTTKKIGMYHVVEDQLVLGIDPNHETVKAMGVAKYLQKVVEVLEHKNHEKYYVSKTIASYKNSGLKYYWLIPEDSINRMQKETGSSFNLRAWDFAFK